MRGAGLWYYELNERLRLLLVDRAIQEKRPAEDIQAELVAAVLVY